MTVLNTSFGRGYAREMGDLDQTPDSGLSRQAESAPSPNPQDRITLGASSMLVGRGVGATLASQDKYSSVVNEQDRSERIEQIKAALQSGAYAVPATAVTSAIVTIMVRNGES